MYFSFDILPLLLKATYVHSEYCFYLKSKSIWVTPFFSNFCTFFHKVIGEKSIEFTFYELDSVVHSCIVIYQGKRQSHKTYLLTIRKYS